MVPWFSQYNLCNTLVNKCRIAEQKMQAVNAQRSKEKTSFDGKKFHNKDDKFQKQLQSVPTINKGKRVQGVRTDKGVGC